MTNAPCATGCTYTHAACGEHRDGVFFRNASTGSLHCTVGGADCAAWCDLTEPYRVGADGYVYATEV